MASLTADPGEETAKGDFFGAAGAGVSALAVTWGGGFCSCGIGAAPWAVAGFCCAACWPAGGGAEGLGGPGLRASSNLRSASLSTDGVFVCATRFLSETISVFGRLTFWRSSGKGIKVVSCFSLIGTMTGRLKLHFGTKISNAIMTAWVIREIH